MPTPRVLQILGTHGASSFRPQASLTARSGYKPPLLNPRLAKIARKHALVNGSYGTWDDAKGGWLPSWDAEMKSKRWGIEALRPYKGRKSDRTRAARAAAIDEKMEKMPELIQDYRMKERERTEKKEGVEALYKRIIARAGRR